MLNRLSSLHKDVSSPLGTAITLLDDLLVEAAISSARLIDNSGQTDPQRGRQLGGAWPMAHLKEAGGTNDKRIRSPAVRFRSLSAQIRSPAARIHGRTARIRGRLRTTSARPPFLPRPTPNRNRRPSRFLLSGSLLEPTVRTRRPWHFAREYCLIFGRHCYNVD
jgi:hypothetical protein